MNQTKLVYAQGRKEVSLPAAGYIAVASVAPCQVYSKVGYPNEPETLNLLGTVTGGETVFGPYTLASTVVLFAGASPAYYAAGIATPRTMQQAQSQIQGAPGVLNATGTLTGAMIAAGIVTSTTAAAVAATLDTGTVLDTILDMDIGASFDWSVIATGANAFTVTASAGHTLVGSGVVATVSAAMFRTRKTAAATYITYRLSGL